MAFIGDLLGANLQSQTSSGHYLDFHVLKPFHRRLILLLQVEKLTLSPSPHGEGQGII